jgi:hypothetical protein
MNNDNPFLTAKLFRTDKDQERIDKEKADLQASKINISFTLYHGWFSQSDADKNNFYEEWENMNGATVAVTSVVDKQNSTKPVSDARYVGTLAKRIRKVNLEGNEITNRSITILYGTTSVYIPNAINTLDALGKSGIALSSASTYSIRIEKNGFTVYEGPYRDALNYEFDEKSSYTLVIKAAEKAIPAPTSAAVQEIVVTCDGRLFRLTSGTTLKQFLFNYIPNPSRYTYTYNGVVIVDPTYYPLTSNGVLTYVPKEIAPVQTTTAPSHRPTPTPTPTAYVDAKLAGIKNNGFTSIKDVEGNLCHTQAEIDTSIRKYYKENRATATFLKGTVKEDPHALHKQALRRWPVGTAIVASRTNITWIPVCTLEDWTRVLGVDVPSW